MTNIKLIQLYLICFFSIAGLYSCEKNSEDGDGNVFTLTESQIEMTVGEKRQIEYSFTGNKPSPQEINWKSSNEKIIIVTNTGELNAVGVGKTIVSVSFRDILLACEINVTDGVVSEPLNLKFLSAPYSDPIGYSINVSLIAPFRVMQSFDFDKFGNIYYSQIGVAGGFEPGKTKAHEVYIVKSKPNMSGNTDFMTLKYFGHGGNIAIEEDDKGELYVWVGSNATKYSSGEYWDEQSVSRIPYRAGQVYDGHAGESFFLNNGRLRIQAAVNRENDLLCINATNGGVRYFYTYKLSDALSLSLKDFTFSVKIGGEELGSAEQIVSRTVKGRDLSELTPLGSFSLAVGNNKAVDVNSLPFQGYDIDGSKHIYFFEGNWTEGTGSLAYVTVFDLQGKIVRTRTKVGALSDINRLVYANITNKTGYMEGEGIKVKGNQLYLGFASYQSEENFRRANIFKYNGTRN